MSQAKPNPKLEARNPKQIRNRQIRRLQTGSSGAIGVLNILFILNIRICFEFRYSDFELSGCGSTGMKERECGKDLERGQRCPFLKASPENQRHWILRRHRTLSRDHGNGDTCFGDIGPGSPCDQDSSLANASRLGTRTAWSSSFFRRGSA